MKVYLAGPMRNYPDFNFPEFHKYAALLRAEGHEVFNPAELGLPQSDMRAILAVELDWICREAEAVALMPGWSKSRGARAEAALARALDLKLMGVPGFRPTRNLESSFLSEPQFSTISPWPSQKWHESHLRVKSSTEPKVGTGLSPETRGMLWFVIFLSVAALTPMACLTLLKWLGVR